MSAINQHASQIFPIWENNLEREPIKPQEVKKVRSFVIKRKVTKEYLERQAKLKPFGFGTSDDDIRQNVNLTSVQRENVWHPYYEVKLEEEDFKEKLQRQKREKRDADVMGGDIADIEGKLKQLEEKERQEQQALLDAASYASSDKKKPLFDLKRLQERKREEEKQEASIPQDDPYTVKLRSLVNEMTEEDIWAAMKRFGDIVKVKIPTEEMRNGKKRNKGFAFVTFKSADSAAKAIDENEIVVDSAILQIERALKAPPRQQDGQGGRPSEFDQLKRNPLNK
ncbi:hypothetical protein FGO68_gene13571 [Halteria grandinella]|uniref:RRM domain-containing protein n=1 Tax=Halteria grandinella TaxID=5974 RepID=A0A8J8NVE3_HALGN|nr:hypothetical protein FGO68_gene13571 [Halteria grandinella]